jgi:Sulfotransferase domain
MTGSAPYIRKMPPLAARCAMGLVTSGIVRPGVWGLERIGIADRVVGAFAERRHKRQAAKTPFRSYAPTEHDVFIATYVKSGTNWMMQIAHELAFHGNAEYEHIHCVVPWPDIANAGPMRTYAIPLNDPSVWQTSPEHKRVIKTHFDWELMPYSEVARYISVIRDPKDVFVSSYFFFVQNGSMGLAMSVDTWLKLFLSERFPMWGSWARSTASYWAQRHRPNVLVVSFKSMKRDLRGTVRKVAELMDMHVADEVIDRVCEKASFEYMKRIDEKFRVWKMVPWGREVTMIRRGVQGGSAELLSPEQQRQVDDYFRAELHRLGSDFPYEKFCDVAPESATQSTRALRPNAAGA